MTELILQLGGKVVDIRGRVKTRRNKNIGRSAALNTVGFNPHKKK